MYERMTRGIKVEVKPAFLDDQSDPSEGQYLWSYTVTVENKGEEPVQLLSRYWHITDARGHVQEVRGPGVVGEQPTIAPGKSFKYTSGCPLTTPSGLMVGEYRMVDPAGRSFDVSIPAFSLDFPEAKRVLN